MDFVVSFVERIFDIDSAGGLFRRTDGRRNWPVAVNWKLDVVDPRFVVAPRYRAILRVGPCKRSEARCYIERHVGPIRFPRPCALRYTVNGEFQTVIIRLAGDFVIEGDGA